MIVYYGSSQYEVSAVVSVIVGHTAAGPLVPVSSAVGLELAPPASSAAVAACWTHHPGGALVPSFVVGEVNLRSRVEEQQ